MSKQHFLNRLLCLFTSPMKLPNNCILASVLLFSLFACNSLRCHGFESAASRTKFVSPTILQQRTATRNNHLATTPSGSSCETMGSLKSLCDVSKRACDAVTPMVVAFYNSIHSSAGTSKLKDDKSAFTIADGAVQHLLTDHLFGRPGSTSKFRGIVGEEDCAVNLSERPFTVDDLTIPDEFVPIVEKARHDISLLAQEIVDCDLYRSLSIFIDPIDGTREFSTAKGEECSICIGFADTKGVPVAGLVYRPITDPPTWAAGSKTEEYFAAELDMVAETAQNKRGLLTSNGSISPFLGAFMNEMGYDQIRSGGAGNKMLMLLEGKGSAYIQDRGVSRWDTCAAQACIEAQGGILCKFTSFLEEKEDSYTYLESETNLDFEAGKSNLTMYNCGPSVGMKKGDPVRLANEVTEVKPYSNLCGIFAVAGKSNTKANRMTILAAAKAASKVSPPAFD